MTVCFLKAANELHLLPTASNLLLLKKKLKAEGKSIKQLSCLRKKVTKKNIEKAIMELHNEGINLSLRNIFVMMGRFSYDKDIAEKIKDVLHALSALQIINAKQKPKLYNIRALSYILREKDKALSLMKSNAACAVSSSLALFRIKKTDKTKSLMSQFIKENESILGTSRKIVYNLPDADDIKRIAAECTSWIELCQKLNVKYTNSMCQRLKVIGVSFPRNKKHSYNQVSVVNLITLPDEIWQSFTTISHVLAYYGLANGADAIKKFALLIKDSGRDYSHFRPYSRKAMEKLYEH